MTRPVIAIIENKAQPAVFHTFGQIYSFTKPVLAVVETEDGEVHQIPADSIQFTDKVKSTATDVLIASLREKEAYYELTAKVAKVDGVAAVYLLTMAPALPSFEYTGELADCFLWYKTPQGILYWDTIYNEVVKLQD